MPACIIFEPFHPKPKLRQEVDTSAIPYSFDVGNPSPMIDGRLRVYARGSSPLCGLALPAPPAGKQDQLSSTGCRARRARSSYPCMHEARKSFVSEVERLHHRTQHGGGSYVLWARRHLHQAGAESWCSAPEPSILKALVGRRSASDIRHH